MEAERKKSQPRFATGFSEPCGACFDVERVVKKAPCLSDRIDANRIPAGYDEMCVIQPATHVFWHPGCALERHHLLIFRVDHREGAYVQRIKARRNLVQRQQLLVGAVEDVCVKINRTFDVRQHQAVACVKIEQPELPERAVFHQRIAPGIVAAPLALTEQRAPGPVALQYGELIVRIRVDVVVVELHALRKHRLPLVGFPTELCDLAGFQVCAVVAVALVRHVTGDQRDPSAGIQVDSNVKGAPHQAIRRGEVQISKPVCDLARGQIDLDRLKPEWL